MILIIDAERVDLAALRPSKHSFSHRCQPCEWLSFLHFLQEHTAIRDPIVVFVDGEVWYGGPGCSKNAFVELDHILARHVCVELWSEAEETLLVTGSEKTVGCSQESANLWAFFYLELTVDLKGPNSTQVVFSVELLHLIDGRSHIYSLYLLVSF